MDEIERAFEVIEIKIGELKLKPGAKLCAIVPLSWTPRQIAMYQAYANEAFKQRGYDFELLCFPHGFELFTISPAGGFE